MSDHAKPKGRYNVYCIEDTGDELFTAAVTNNGVYLDHNYAEGCLFLSHEDFESLDSFRQAFLDEIDGE